MSHSLLSLVETPEIIKTLSWEELHRLAAETRQKIIETMAVNGGHLASNLGTVELTLALHKVFCSPQDRLIWDVSHQTYTHKLLTGRQNRFHQIRQFKGLCGFSHPKESPHDHFQAGHAGTALSLALGMAKNRDLTKRKEFIIPIIGDATLTCGLALEALNNISPDLKNFIIILNDNAMSISKNVGAITRILGRLLSSPFASKIYQELDGFVSKIPNVGPLLSEKGHKITDSLKNRADATAYFDHYGLSYIGPVDGHNIERMVETLEIAKHSPCPTIIHMQTRKGEGMAEAIKNPISYHGAKPFSKDTGKFLPVPSPLPTFPKVFGNHLLQMAATDPSLVAITPAMSAGSCLDAMMEKFPERCLDVGIAESHAITFAGGIAYGGKMKVVVSIYATFLQRAFDNLFHDVCLQELPVVFAIDRAGISGPDGSTHHGIYDISFLNAMPNMVITQPRNGQLLKELLESSFSWKRPTAIRYPNLVTESSNQPLTIREMGKAELLLEGKELLIIALGHMNQTALEVCRLLKEESGIHASLLDPIFLKPLDSDLICRLLLNHQKIVTIEEHSVQSGMGAIVNHFLLSQGFSNLQVLNLGIPETFLEHGSHHQLLSEIGLTPEKICKKIYSFFSFQFSKSICLKE